MTEFPPSHALDVSATRDTTLWRLAGVAALAGALLRLIAAAPDLPLEASGREALYAAIDLLLILSLFGFFGRLAVLHRWVGILGFFCAITGFTVIRTGARLAGPDTYQLGSAILGVGLTLMALVLVRERGLSRLIGIAWIASFGVGVAATGVSVPWGFLVASLLFCLGFFLTGVLLVRPTES